jgi:AcrR family transcriptional regulator
MGRWAPGARGRLEYAALELYSERGFENTTVTEIAERAGLSERTFFRYFADKREVLFWGSQALQEFLARSVEEAPATASPLAAVTGALEKAASEIFEERRELLWRRQKIISANPELQERELIKLAALAKSITAALRRRGVQELPSSLAAEAGIAAFKVAFAAWAQGEGRSLAQVVRAAVEELERVAAQGAGAPDPAQSLAGAGGADGVGG